MIHTSSPPPSFLATPRRNDMKPNKEQLEAYKAMAKDSPDSMKAKIRAHLETNCPKFAGNEDKLDDCLDYLTACACEILDSKSGDVADEVCYRICRDYFDDELWTKEEKPEPAPKKAEKKVPKKAPKKAAIKSTPTPPNPIIEAAKKEPEKLKFPTCRVCGREVINVYKDGMCVECYDKRPMHAEKTAQIQPVPGQLDLFAAMGV